MIGGFAYFANDALKTIVGVNIPWLWFAIGAIVIIARCATSTSASPPPSSAVTLVSEVLILFALAFSVIFKGGGPDG